MSVEILGRYSASTDKKGKVALPLFLERVAAGFPSPATDYVERTLDLNELCIKRPAATYFVRAEGYSMTGAGIYPDDILIVDRSLTATEGDIVIASLYGEMTVKELQTSPVIRLLPCNDDFSPVEIANPDDLELFGVVTHVIHKTRPGRGGS